MSTTTATSRAWLQAYANRLPPPATLEILEERLDSLDRMISNYKPQTPWDAANKRPLRRMKQDRVSVHKAINRQMNKEKEMRRRNERAHRDHGYA